MPLMRVRIADTEAIAKYRITRNGIDIVKIVGLNSVKWGRRNIGLDPINRNKMAAIIAEDVENARKARATAH